MEKQDEKTLFACMAVVEEAAKQAEALRTQAETAIETLPERMAMEISSQVRFAAENAARRLEKAVSGVKELEEVSEKAKERLERTGAILACFVVAAGVVVSLIAGGVVWWSTDSLRTEAKNLKTEITFLENKANEARSTVLEIEKKTSGIVLEIFKTQSNRYWVKLKKGQRVGERKSVWSDTNQEGFEVFLK